MSPNYNPYYKTAMIFVAVFMVLNIQAQQQSNNDTLFKSKDTLIVHSTVKQVFDYPLWDKSLPITSVFTRGKKEKKWKNLVDTIFYEPGDYFMTVNYYYFNSSVVKLCNTYHNNVYYKTKLRFAFLIVIDSIKIVNSLRVIDEGEVCGQYRLARIRPKTTDNETTYINTSYDQLQDNYLNDEKYGVKFSIDSNSKFIKKIEFTSAFFTNYAPNLKDKFEKIEVLNNGKAIVIK